MFCIIILRLVLSRVLRKTCKGWESSPTNNLTTALATTTALSTKDRPCRATWVASQWKSITRRTSLGIMGTRPSPNGSLSLGPCMLTSRTSTWTNCRLMNRRKRWFRKNLSRWLPKRSEPTKWWTWPWLPISRRSRRVPPLRLQCWGIKAPRLTGWHRWGIRKKCFHIIMNRSWTAILWRKWETKISIKT